MQIETIGNATLYLGDCFEVLQTLVADIDAVVSDPPYGIGFKPQTRSTKSNDVYAGGSFSTSFDPIAGDQQPFDPRPFISLPAILWGANNYSDKLPPSNGWLCWYKCGGISGFSMSECELAWSNVVKSTQFFDHLWHGFKRASQNGERVNHPTEKPIAVMEWCLGFIPKARTILDPFMGSGTTGVAAINLGRKFTGIEIEPKYFDIACRRIADAVSRPRLDLEPIGRRMEQLGLYDEIETVK